MDSTAPAPEVFGRYRLLTRLAQGGMAELSLALQQGVHGFEKVVVLKRMLPSLGNSHEFVEMFLDEARLAARLEHPNVVRIYDLGQEAGQYFIAMEFIPGEDLATVTAQARKTDKKIPYDVAADFAMGAAEGLAYAHGLADATGRSLRIVHRDVSPSNIIASYHGGVKVVDFGIARATSNVTKTAPGSRRGKIHYLSPEQATGKSVDQRSDLFSLGIVLHELLTGVRLLQRDTEVATIKAITSEVLQPPGAWRPDVPKALSDIVMQAMERDVSKRYQSAAEMAMDLGGYLKERGYVRGSTSAAFLATLLGEARRTTKLRIAQGGAVDDLARIAMGKSGLTPSTPGGSRRPPAGTPTPGKPTTPASAQRYPTGTPVPGFGQPTAKQLDPAAVATTPPPAGAAPPRAAASPSPLAATTPTTPRPASAAAAPPPLPGGKHPAAAPRPAQAEQPFETFGKYEILQRIGAGGMAEVYKGRLRKAGGFEKAVVIKKIRNELVEDPEFVAMFLDEARVSAYLSHPNIVQVFEVDMCGNVPFIAMEFVNGPTLLALLERAKKTKALNWAMGARIVSEICEGLEHAHTAVDAAGAPLKVIHRDVTPQNVIVATAGTAKLLDFGLAKAAGRQTRTRVGTLKGKLRYMGPEQMRDVPIDARADVYSAGLCLYEATTGDAPYGDRSDAEIIRHVLVGQTGIPDEFPEGYPKELERIVRWASDPDPDDRCPSCQELHQAIDAFLATCGKPTGPRDVAAWLASLYPEAATTPNVFWPDAVPVAGSRSAQVPGVGAGARQAPPQDGRPRGVMPPPGGGSAPRAPGPEGLDIVQGVLEDEELPMVPSELAAPEGQAEADGQPRPAAAEARARPAEPNTSWPPPSASASVSATATEPTPARAGSGKKKALVVAAFLLAAAAAGALGYWISQLRR